MSNINTKNEELIIKILGTIVVVTLVIIGYNLINLHSVSGGTVAENYYQNIGWVIEAIALLVTLFLHIVLTKLKINSYIADNSSIIVEQNKKLIKLISEQNKKGDSI